MNPDPAGRPPAIVLLSGGMDSCVTAAIARQDHDLALLHVGYGQRTEARELRAFREIAAHYGVTRTLVTRLDHLRAIGGSALTDPMRDAVEARRAGSSIPETYVPFRNTHLLAVAVSWGEVIGARRIFIGAVEEDSSGYPDCRAEYYVAFNRLLRVGTRPETDLTVVTPLIQMSKAEIVRQGLRLQAPFHLTWSCYTESEAACGRCESCRLRLKGFREAGATDPLPYLP
ncbi:MAG TPA: 7-cyano-7-deazaguanine synthase QueC [Candidatus Polarisedimenticolia bacterium]|nr:7-cyano-7-deazaguanine synthase QueC [Candidatus Polarisedimenticolia bacterium]